MLAIEDSLNGLCGTVPSLTDWPPQSDGRTQAAHGRHGSTKSQISMTGDAAQSQAILLPYMTAMGTVQQVVDGHLLATPSGKFQTPDSWHSPTSAAGPQPKSSLQARLLTSANLAWACLRINKPAAPQIAVGMERPVSTPHHPHIYPAWPFPEGLRC